MDITTYALEMEKRLLSLVTECFNPPNALRKLSTLILVRDRMAAAFAGWGPSGQNLDLDFAVWLLLVKMAKTEEATSKTLLGRFLPGQKKGASELRLLESRALLRIDRFLIVGAAESNVVKVFSNSFDQYIKDNK